MRRHPAAEVHAYRSKLLFLSSGLGPHALGARPHAGAAGHPEGRNAEGGSRADHGLFQLAYVPAHQSPNLAQLQKPITHDLILAMIGDVAAAIGMMELDAQL